MYISSSGTMSFFNRKTPIKYDLKSLKPASKVIEDAPTMVEKGIEPVDWYELKDGVTYYVINPDFDEKSNKPVNLPEVNRFDAFVRLSPPDEREKVNGMTKVNGVKFNIYNNFGRLIGRDTSFGEGSVVSGPIWSDSEYYFPPRYIFYDADKLLSASQSAGNKRKKHSSNKLSKRRVKTKSRRRNNITHRRKQGR
jgi:hypothetical protein